MGKANTFALMLILVLTITCVGLLVVKPASAQTTASQKPALPEFTLTFVPASETLTHIDPLTGAKTFELVDKSTIQVKIRNQPFEENVGGVNYYLYYSIFVAGHFDPSNQSDWQGAYSFPDDYTTNPSYPNTLEATTSEYTTGIINGNYPSQSQIDISVGAMLMHDGQFRVYNYIGDLTGHLVSGVVEGEISQSKQTYVVPNHQTSLAASPNTASVTNLPTESVTSASASTSPKPTGNVFISLPLVTFIAIIVAFTLVIISLLFLLFCKRAKQHSAMTSRSL